MSAFVDDSETRARPSADPSATAHARVRLPRLDSTAFAHPFDRQTLSALRRLKGFDFAVGKLIEWQHERGAHVQHSSSSVRVTARQLPGIHALLTEACEILDMEAPELYVTAGPMNALTSGHNSPYIVLFSDLVDAMSDAELQAVIAHELGHIKCQHVLYKEMVRWLTQVGLAGVSGVPKLAMAAQVAVKFLVPALVRWDQKSELSADRAAMLVVQDEDVCIRMLLKLAGAPSRFADELDAQEFLEQARHLQDLTFESSIADRHHRALAGATTHPLTVERARLLDRWIQNGEYAKVLAQPDVPVQLPEADEQPGRRQRATHRWARSSGENGAAHRA
jgi:Zn-dependent protease with chaperone function